MISFKYFSHSDHCYGSFAVHMNEADEIESEQINIIKARKQNLHDNLQNMKSKEAKIMDQTLAKLSQVEFEAQEVVDSESDNELVSI